jgi:hypothetical protein
MPGATHHRDQSLPVLTPGTLNQHHLPTGSKASSTTEVATTTCIAIPGSPPTSRSDRRVDTRIRPRRMTWMTYSAPTPSTGA